MLPESRHLFNQAVSAYQSGAYSTALDLCARLLNDSPDTPAVSHLKAVTLMATGALSDALSAVEEALSIDKTNGGFYNTLGVLHTELLDFPKALAAHEKALHYAPGDADAQCNAGRVLIRMNRFDEAIAILKAVVSAHPEHAIAHANLALGLRLSGNPASALNSYQKALDLNPNHRKWRYNLGVLHMEMDNHREAAAVFEALLTATPDDPAVLDALGTAYRALGILDQSIACYEKILAIEPGNAGAAANLAIAYRYVCDWPKTGQMDSAVEAHTHDAIRHGRTPEEQPLLNVMRADDPEMNGIVAGLHSRQIALDCNDRKRVFAFQQRARTDRPITIGYLSADFRNHPVAHQMVRLYALHDRRKFRVLCFSTGPNDNSAFRCDIAQNCDHFFDLQGAGPRTIARAINDQQVDILVDLSGHTHGNQLSVCACRPAPIQVSYLGFLASTGSNFIDYMVCDKIVVPKTHAPFYSEKLVWMPGCYQITNNRQPVSPLLFDRKSNNLPENGFVFCCFNQSYKIDAAVFSCWMHILDQVPGSVLWLYEANPMAMHNLISAAGKAGIDGQRLVFAPKLALDEHLSRLRLADIALDTFRYNGGATTANALWASVPVVSKMGGHFVSRMSASNLIAAGLPELVVDNDANYERLATDLARDPRLLSKMKTKLTQGRKSSRLFDTEQFVIDLEQAYSIMWERYNNHEAPAPIDLGRCQRPEGKPNIHSKKGHMGTNRPINLGKPIATRTGDL